jgi:integrase/recombinase XerD
LLRFKEKGGKEKELPVHHKLEELLDQYLKASGLEKEPGSPLFPAAWGKTGKLWRKPLVRTDAADMLKRRLKTSRIDTGRAREGSARTLNRAINSLTI